MSYQATISLAKAYLAKAKADEAAADATLELRAAQRQHLPLGESFTVQVGNVLVTVTRTGSDRQHNAYTYDYLVSTPVEN